MPKSYLPARKSESLMSDVVAISPPTSMWLPRPKRMPLPLMSQTWPLAKTSPLIVEASVPTTRLRRIAAAFGCRKVTFAPDPIEKLRQLISAFWLDWVISRLVSLGEPPDAWPEATEAPEGRMGVAPRAKGAPRARASTGLPASAVSLRNLLGHPPFIFV